LMSGRPSMPLVGGQVLAAERDELPARWRVPSSEDTGLSPLRPTSRPHADTATYDDGWMLGQHPLHLGIEQKIDVSPLDHVRQTSPLTKLCPSASTRRCRRAEPAVLGDGLGSPSALYVVALSSIALKREPQLPVFTLGTSARVSGATTRTFGVGYHVPALDRRSNVLGAIFVRH